MPEKIYHAKRQHYLHKRPPAMQTKNGIDLAPMIDIFFLLLAYFLINLTLARTPAGRVELPGSKTASYASDGAIDRYIQADGSIQLGTRNIPDRELTMALKNTLALQPTQRLPEINTKGDAKVDYQRIIFVVDQVKKAGLSNFNLSTIHK